MVIGASRGKRGHAGEPPGHEETHRVAPDAAEPPGHARVYRAVAATVRDVHFILGG